ncbi:MAG: ACT domain-containing protein [Spirochaetaceae bacterium]|jgi:ACT domain-containing protein|nr:ACT domain-containing protein [Spirochaetaceae bacterium]
MESSGTSSAIVSVVGTDQVGIIAKVTAFFAGHDINIVDINQTILSGNFVMMMMVDISKQTANIETLKRELAALGDSINVSISIMHEKVFNAMHRI